MALDIFNPQVSVVSKDLSGKTLLVYGSNRTGKTAVGTSLPKPLYLALENGLAGRAGVPNVNIEKWSDFLKAVKQLTRADTLDKVKGMYQTIIVDTIEAGARYCDEYVCEKHGAETIASGNRGFGLWKELSTELWRPINQLSSVGFTVYFIAHEGTKEFKNENGEEYTKIYPRGEKRMVDMVCDLVDIICFVQPNGLDDNGTEIKSSAYFKNTRKYHAGSRFDYMPEMIKEFTAENLTKAIAKAVELEEEHGNKVVSTFQEQAETHKVERMSFDELQDAIKAKAMQMQKLDKMQEYKEIVETHLGVGGSVREATQKQSQLLEMVLDDLNDLIA